MPKGPKKSPQESIDSILLAIGRREDLDEDTMSHYLARLNEEWTNGAREKVLHLLRSNEPSAQAAALRILTELATEFDLEELEDFVTDPTVSDIAKLSLAPLLKELDSEITDESMAEYLNDPVGSVRQMQMRLLELVGQNEMGIETILEDVVSMPVDRRLAFISWLGNSNDPRAASLLLPLLEYEGGKVATAVLEALEQLGPIAVSQTIPMLNYIVATSSNRLLKQQARTTLGHLTMQSMLGAEDVALMEARQGQLPLYQARMSALDGSGSQLIMLSWRRSDGLIKGVNILFYDQQGVKDCYGVDEMALEQWKSLVDDLNEQGFQSFLVPFAYVQAVLSNARVTGKKKRQKLPIAYAIWRPFIEGREPQKTVTKMPVMLDPLDLDDEVIALGKTGEALYNSNELKSWLYEPIERIEPFISRYWAMQNRFESSPRGGKKTQKMQERQLQVDQLIDEAIDTLIDETWRSLYEQRLRRQAAFFQQLDRHTEVALLRATATILHPDSGIDLSEQTFPRKFIHLSIEQGPLRLMIESMHNSGLNSLPFDLPD
jgi:hypothetical protein